MCVVDKYREVNYNIVELNDEELNYWLSKFVTEVRQKKEPGRCYTPNTLYQICRGL